MWCPTCQKSMPTRASQVEAGAADCMQCGETLKRVRPANGLNPSKSNPLEHLAGLPGAPVASQPIAPKPAVVVPEAPSKPRRVSTPPHPQWSTSSDWEVSEKVQALRRKLNLLKGVGDYAGALEECQREEVNQKLHSVIPAAHVRFDRATSTAPAASGRSRSRALGRDTDQEAERVLPANPFQLGWTVLAFGLTCSACGGVLLGWSSLAERADLWKLGLPATIVGLASLLLGLVLQLDSLRKQIAERPAARMPTEADLLDRSSLGQTYIIHEAHPTDSVRPASATLGAHFSRRAVR